MPDMLDKQINITSGARFIRKGRKSPQNQTDSLMSVLMSEEDVGQGLKSESSAIGSLEEVHTQAWSVFLRLWVGENVVSGKLSACVDKGL